MTRNRDRWKATERRIAAELGGRRVPVTGRSRGDAPDIEHPLLSLEVKSRAILPAWLHDAMDQAEAAAVAGRVPTAVLHQTGTRYADALCIIRLSALSALVAAAGDDLDGESGAGDGA